MENKKYTDFSCDIVMDLLPSYIDEICSEDTRDLVQAHIATCEKCAKALSRMASKDFAIEGVLPEDTDVLDITEAIKKREKRQKNTSKALGGISIVLAICLIISVVPGRDFKTITSSDGNLTADAEALVDVAADEKIGDYTVAGDYAEIYDYAKKVSSDKQILRGFGTDVMEIATEEAAEAAVEDVAVSTSTAVKGDGAFSTTNIMTEGVDESDISKTDGKFIYNATSSEIIVFDIRTGKAEELSRITPQFEDPSDIIRDMYIDGDKMAVITDHIEPNGNEYINQTIAIIYDIADRENAKYLDSYKQDGVYNTSRKIGDLIYLFTNRYLEKPQLARPLATTEENIGKWFPKINDKVISPDCVYLPNEGTNIFVMSSFNWNNAKNTVDTKVMVNNHEEIYVSNSSIFLYGQTYNANRAITKITKLNYKDGKISTGAATSIRGFINDSFAINENDNYLRVVATETDNGTVNTLYVFDGSLNECGRINNIANGEQLYACRFVGDKGYFVTFLNTDPLFAVDLSDPNNPKLIGELKVYGFSEYLHLWDEKTLLGIGYDADENGNRTGLKLSMFDISNEEEMTEKSKYVIRDGDYAPGFYNYKAILVSPLENVIGFAYENYENGYTMYDIYSYENGEFVKLLSQQSANNMAERIRGHFSGDYYYISEDTKVSSFVR